VARETFGERTHRATPRRREEARREGQVARSVELSAALALLVALAALAAFGPGMLQRLGDLTRSLLSGTYSPVATPAAAYRSFRLVSVQVLVTLAPLLLSLLAIGVISNVLQVGFLFTSRPLSPRLSRLDPFQGFARVFGRRGLVELAKALVKVGVIGVIAYLTLSTDLESLLPSLGTDGGALLERVGGTTLKLGLRIGLALLALAALDYGYQRWEHERSIRMSQKEIEEEQKQQEGDPRVRARIRILQRLLSRRRMMAEVPQADVIVTNPVHVAVALKYDRRSMRAPVVVARGMRKLAEKIKKVAGEHSVPIVEDPPLARLLYKEAPLGRPIPVSLYRAVAQVLAHVWRLRERGPAAARGGRTGAGPASGGSANRGPSGGAAAPGAEG
jgi:flagellar biosynthetic protein FlhB